MVIIKEEGRKQAYYPDFNNSLPREFYLGDTINIARELIGKVLVRQLDSGTYLAAGIVETEAYLDINDKASHSAPGRTQRNAPMFARGGILYVYMIYGVHHCINIVTEEEGKGCAVLLRAAEPIAGIDEMIKLRGTQKIESLCKGPGNLAKAFSFNTSDNYSSLCQPSLFIQEADVQKNFIVESSKRTGITKDIHLPYRFFLKGSEFVSGKNH